MSDTSTIELPPGWVTRELREIVEVLDSRRKPVNSKERATRVGVVPYYGAAGQVGTIDEALFDEDLVLLGEDGVQFFDPDKHKAYEISGPAWVNNHAHVLRCRGNIMSQRLLVHYLNQFDYRNRANGTTRLKLTQAAMNDIPVLVPPLAEQEKIVEILEGQLSRLDAALASVRTVREKAAKFRRSLLHAASTGALTGHNTSSDAFPNEWTSECLQSVCELITDGSHFSPRTVADGYPYITVRDLGDNGIDFEDCKFINEESFLELSRNGCQPLLGDVLFSKDGTVGKVALVETDIEFVVLSSLAILRVNCQKIVPRFLKFALSSPAVLESALGMKTGTALRRIVLRNLKTVKVSVPPLAEQAKIVEILEEQLSHLDASLAIAEVVEKRVAALRRSLLYAAFTGKLTADWRASAHV